MQESYLWERTQGKPEKCVKTKIKKFWVAGRASEDREEWMEQASRILDQRL